MQHFYLSLHTQRTAWQIVMLSVPHRSRSGGSPFPNPRHSVPDVFRSCTTGRGMSERDVGHLGENGESRCGDGIRHLETAGARSGEGREDAAQTRSSSLFPCREKQKNLLRTPSLRMHCITDLHRRDRDRKVQCRRAVEGNRDGAPADHKACRGEEQQVRIRCSSVSIAFLCPSLGDTSPVVHLKDAIDHLKHDLSEMHVSIALMSQTLYKCPSNG